MLADAGHDLCGAATDVPPASSFVDYVDTRAATPDAGDPTPSCGFGVDGSTVWYRYAATIDGTVSVSTEGTDYETVLSVWGPDEACGALTTEVECDDIGADEEFALLDFPVAAGETSFVEVGDPNAVGGELIISFIPEPDATLLMAIALLALAGLRSRRQGLRLGP